jgi:SGNH domain (fused to AT3 domains)
VWISRLLMLAVVALALVVPASSGASGFQTSSCFGAGVFGQHCAGSKTAANLSLRVFPSIDSARHTKWRYGSQRNDKFCNGGLRWRDTLLTCSLGVTTARADKTVALIGDSHSAAWRPAIDAAANARHWNVISLVQGSCDYNIVTQDRGGYVDAVECRRWRLRIPSFLAARPSIHTVIFAEYSYEGRGQSPAHEIAAYHQAWKLLPASIRQLVVIRDNPHGGVEYYKCIEAAQSRHAALGAACASPRTQVLEPDYAAAAAKSELGRKARVVDLSDTYCNRKVCFPVIGGALVYGENNHVTPTFNRTLAPTFLAALDKGDPID